MKRIAIDMDEVVADTMSRYLDLYNADFGFDLTRDHFHGRRVFEVIDPAHIARARAYFEREDFFAEIPVMPGSQEVIRELCEHYEIFITTAAMDVPCSFSAKYQWLQRHFPFVPPKRIVFCGDKSIIAADFMLDDDPKHFRRFGGEGIIYTAPHNVHETRFRRVDTWHDVRNLFLAEAVVRS
jgi:5'(3')-deoxyribonucleotidase